MQISAIGVTKRFGSFLALDNITVEARSGELLALLGPSGSGKTTLLRIIAGLDWPDSGQVLFDGVDALSRSVGQRHVGFVFQHFALFRHMTVADNVAFGLRARKRSTRPDAATITRRVDELLALVQLDGLAKRYPSQLSGGQRQRVALARALAIEPQVLLLDEPFGALDAKVRKELRTWLRGLHREIGLTSVFVTHDQEEAMEMADRVVVMGRAQIEQIGTPQEVYENPTSAFVHEFIGESISLPVTVASDGVRFAGQRLGAPPQPETSGPARLMARPHDAVLTAPAEGALRGKVTRVHGIGAARRVDVTMPGHRAALAIDAPRHQNVSVGEDVGIRLERFRLFPEAPAQG